MKFIDVLKRQLEEKIAERDAAKSALDALLEVPTSEARDLNADEAAAFESRKGEIAAAKADITALEARIAELAELDAKEARATEAKPAYDAVVRVGTEARTYNPDAEKRGVSFLRDLANQWSDPNAAGRIQRHLTEQGVEQRDLGTGGVAGLTVPQYLTDLVAPLRRAGRPFADICTSHALPADGMTVNISRITTGSTTAAQASENTNVSEQDIDDTLLTINVRTIAGQQDVSRQALDRSSGVEQIVLADLVAAYNTTLDAQILNADGTSGTHLGLKNTSSIATATLTTGSPTAALLYPKLFEIQSAVQSGYFGGVSHFVMHPRRWNWLASQVGTSFPFLQINGSAPQVGGSVDSNGYGGAVGVIAGVPVVLDANVETNIGAGTNQDTIWAVTSSELHLWEDTTAPLFIRAEQTTAGSLSVKFVVYGYSAFSAGRHPGAHGSINGTGLVTPTF